MNTPWRHYRWQGQRQGSQVSGHIWAPGSGWARVRLAQQGVLSVRLRRQWRPTRGLAQAQARVMRQWAALLQSGVRVVPALELLSAQDVPAPLQIALAQTAQQVQAGVPLHEALSAHPQCFDPMTLALVQAGQAAGELPALLEQLAQALGRQDNLRRKVRSALTYPAAVLTVAALALVLMMWWVVPVFEEVFQSMGAPLPAATQAVLEWRKHGAQYGLWCLAAGVLPALWLRQWAQSASGQAWLHRLGLSWPLLGPTWQALVCARWAHTLHTLLQAGVPLADALPVASQASAQEVYRALGRHLQRRVQSGERLSQAMADSQRFPVLLVQMCATGEETGTLAALLGQAAQLLAQEAESRIDGLTALIEPLTVLLLGLAIGGILVAMYLPIFQLGQAF